VRVGFGGWGTYTNVVQVSDVYNSSEKETFEVLVIVEISYFWAEGLG
jgi:hypothetical protein